jgi:hypothetical protein
MPAATEKKSVKQRVEAPPSPSWFWIKNSKGESSASVTFLTISFIVTTFSYIAATFEHIGPLTIRPFDAGACSAYFIPLLTLYFGRRWTDAKFSDGSKEG